MTSMALVRLRGPLKQLAGGPEHAVAGATVAELLTALERDRPALHGWILDINVFVNGERGGEDTAIGADDRVDVLPAISGGSA
jgi:molybdopterin synthase sulfur carrier subunit